MITRRIFIPLVGGESKQVKQRSLLINQRGKEKVSLLNSGLQEIMAKGIIISRELYFHSLYLSDDGCVQVFMGPQPQRVKALWSSGGAGPEKQRQERWSVFVGACGLVDEVQNANKKTQRKANYERKHGPTAGYGAGAETEFG